jgi:hypothetical protein
MSCTMVSVPMFLFLSYDVYHTLVFHLDACLVMALASSHSGSSVLREVEVT